MAFSLTLKGRNGKPMGYIMRVGDALTCKAAAENTLEALLCIMFEDGASGEWRIQTDGRECSIPAPAAGMAYAYVFGNGELIAATGKEAEKAYDRKSMHIPEKKEKNSANSRKKEPDLAVNIDGERIDKGQETYAGLQMRWPPPPCWPTARYVDGVWREVNEAGGDMRA